jgi:hypothetical protein
MHRYSFCCAVSMLSFVVCSEIRPLTCSALLSDRGADGVAACFRLGYQSNTSAGRFSLPCFLLDYMS